MKMFHAVYRSDRTDNCLTGCSDKKEYTNAVPADTQVLARFDLVAIAPEIRG